MLKVTEIPDYAALHPGYGHAKHERLGVYFFGYFLWTSKDKFIRNVVCCAADPKGKSQGRDLQRNSLQQERNHTLNYTRKERSYSTHQSEYQQSSINSNIRG